MQPNIIFIMADDLGYGELGVYGQSIIQTPNIDYLASKGIRFTNYYTGSPVCAPSRCILLTGKHSGHAQVRGNDEVNHRGEVWNYRAMAQDSSLEGQAPMSDTTITIVHQLKRAGYETALFGKWGLGYPGSVSVPTTMGFDHFVGYNCQRQAHTLTPLHLWCNDQKIILANDTIAPSTKLALDDDPYDLESYARYIQPDYAPRIIFDSMISYIESVKNQPFTIFWETPLPHVPLQAPKEWVDHYHNIIGDEAPYLGDKGYFPTRYPRATYAAMISYLDENVGKLMDYLEENDLFDNTIIMFTSDNGPSYAGGVDPVYFNSAGPFQEEYGWGKGFLHEGGIRVPMIVSWPKQITPNTITHHISSSQDIYPTLADIAGIEYGSSQIDGVSFMSSLFGRDQEAHEYLYWEFPEYGGQRAIRINQYKLYQKDLHKGNQEIELFDLENDPQEKHNIAQEHPDIILRGHEIFKKEHIPSPNSKWQFAVLDSEIKNNDE